MKHLKKFNESTGWLYCAIMKSKYNKSVPI